MNDKRIMRVGVLVLNVIIIVGLFVLEHTTQNDIFNETIVGLVIGNGIGLLQGYAASDTAEVTEKPPASVN